MNDPIESTEMKDLTLQQLEDRRDVIEEESATIKAKLDKVRGEQKATGQWADPDWYRRAKTRVRFLGVEHQRICREIGRRKREAKAAYTSSIERAFVVAAKAFLPQATFDAIMGTATSEVARG